MSSAQKTLSQYSIRMRGVVSAMSDATLDRWFRLVSRHDGSPPRRDNESPWISLSHCINPLARWLIPPTWECGFHLRPGHTTDRTTSPTTPLIAPQPPQQTHTHWRLQLVDLWQCWTFSDVDYLLLQYYYTTYYVSSSSETLHAFPWSNRFWPISNENSC